MQRTLLSLAFGLLLLLLLPTAGSAARYDVRVGIGDQSSAMFDDRLFERADIERTRYFIPWNAARDDDQMAWARAYLRDAREHGIEVLVHLSTDDLRIRRGKLPSVRRYKRLAGELVDELRPLGVREWGVWNEANHKSQPTWRAPGRAAKYFKAFRKVCRGCRIVALDVLDQRGVERYVKRFYRKLSPFLDRKARFVGIHNYSDVNRRRMSGTRDIMRSVRRHGSRRAKFWLTETGGVVELGRSFRCSERRAARRTRYLFKLLRKERHAIQRAYIYNWYGTNCSTRMDTGLVDRDGDKRRAYRVFRRNMRNFKR